MWFSNAIVYGLDNFETKTQELNSLLSKKTFKECLPSQVSTIGWISPFGMNSEVFAHDVSGCVLLSMKAMEKTVPASILKEELEKKIAEMKRKNPDTKISKSIRSDLKEQIRNQLLPRAFPKFTQIHGYLDKNRRLVVIDTSSRKKAEQFLSLLRSTLDEPYKIVRHATTNSPAAALSEWVCNSNIPEQISIGSKCTLRDQEGTGTIKYAKQDLNDTNIQDYLSQGKVVSQLDISWKTSISCIINEELVFSSIKFPDKDKAMDETTEAQDEGSQIDTIFYVMSSIISEFYPYIIESLGGYDESRAGNGDPK